LTDSGNPFGLTVCQSPIGTLGLTVCYDLRFPEMFRVMTLEHNANIFLVPAAWTKHTFPHWEILLKSRAIENQCYVIAAAQWGKHNDKRDSAGSSMVIDPWGAVVARMSDKEGLILAEIDLDFLQKVRTNMPVLSHTWIDRISFKKDKIAS